MTSEVQQRVVFITGASGVIGKALTNEFLGHGWKVIAGYFSGQIAKDNDNLFPVKVDITDNTQVREIFSTIREEFGRLDCLINAAGVVCDDLIFNMTEADWEKVIKVNLIGTVNCSREAIGIMAGKGGGHIINFSSISAKTGRMGQSNYVASKAAVIGFSLCLAKESGSANIRVNVIIPGFIESKMTSNLKEEIKSNLIAENVLGRTTNAGEIARFCHFLSTTENISGQVFQLDSRIIKWI